MRRVASLRPHPIRWLAARWLRLRREPARLALGRRGERVAAAWLTERGYTIQACNVRVPGGEIDLIAQCGRTLCFVEVRSVSSAAWGGALDTVNRAKRERIRRAARWYLSRHPEHPAEVRFDVIGITWQGAAAPTLELIEHAFTADE